MIVGQAGHTVRDAVRDVERRGPVVTPALVGELDAVLAACFVDAQSKVPVDTGALLASGRSGSSVRDDGDTWIGYMAWDGETSDGSASRAIYAMANGPESDWLHESYLYEQAIEHVIDAHLRGYWR